MGFKSQNTHTWIIKVTWFGVALYWGSTSGSEQGHIKVIFKGKADTLLNRNPFYSFHVFSGYWWPYCFGPSDDIET